MILHIAVRLPGRQKMPSTHRGKGRNRRNAQFFRLPPLAPHDSIRGVASRKEFRAIRPPMPFGGAGPALPFMNPAHIQHYEPTGVSRL
ncbi:hypothetical protein ACV22V_19180 [Burkholderia sp. AW33-5]|uniref:hypothetical protein n=1 Tax=Burkholderia diffusa TaxID=488732 RepID=UPI001CC48E65|nr:hypothetical protein [Burkholderia diffusa]